MNKDNLYIFLGSYIGENFEILNDQYYINSSCLSNSEYEKCFFETFNKLGFNSIMLSCPNVGKYPNYCKKPYFDSKLLTNDNSIEFVSFSTNYWISNFSKQRNLIAKISKIINANFNKNIFVIAFEAHGPYLSVLKFVKNKYKCKTCLIVPDLPEYMISSQSYIYRILKKIDIQRNYALANKYCDSFLLFTPKMTEKYNVDGKPYLIREGIIEKYSYKNTNNRKPNCCFIGKTNIENGIDKIIEAAKEMPYFDFNIYGSGAMDNELASVHLDNLHFFGFIDPLKVEEILLNNDILLSPRYPGAEYTKFSFPSKIMKFISCSKPIVTYRLDCYQDYFDGLFFMPADTTTKSFIAQIEKASKIINKDLRKEYEQATSNFYKDKVINDFVKMLGEIK